MTFLCLYISRWWRQTWDTAPYFTVVNQSEARISTEHGINIHVSTRAAIYPYILMQISCTLEYIKVIYLFVISFCTAKLTCGFTVVTAVVQVPRTSCCLEIPYSPPIVAYRNMSIYFPLDVTPVRAYFSFPNAESHCEISWAIWGDVLWLQRTYWKLWISPNL